MNARQSAENDALALIREAFEATFAPDFCGVDWRDDAAIQAFANRVIPVLYPRLIPPGSGDES